MTSVPAEHPHQNDLARINQAKGFWRLSPQENGEIHVTYQFHANPELKLPTWLLNMLTVDGPYQALQYLRELDGQASYLRWATTTRLRSAMKTASRIATEY